MFFFFLFWQELSTEVAEAYNVIPNLVSNQAYFIWYIMVHDLITGFYPSQICRYLAFIARKLDPP
jgi:hypothetical protein